MARSRAGLGGLGAPVLLAFVHALLLGAPSAGAASEVEERPRRGIARLRFEELQALPPSARASLRRALRGEGAVLLTGVPGLGSAAGSALEAISDCFARADEAEVGGGERGPVRSRLPGGARRTSLASKSERGAIGPLPTWAEELCPGLGQAAAPLRAHIGLVLSLFARSADAAAFAGAGASADDADLVGSAERDVGGASVRGGAAAGEREAPGIRGSSASSALPARGSSSSTSSSSSDFRSGSGLSSFEDLVRRGTLLEHFHRYSPPPPSVGFDVSEAATAAMTMHTDAGMLQALTVRWRRHGPAGEAASEASFAGAGAAGEGLEIELPGGEVVSAEPCGDGRRLDADDEEGNGLLLMIGQGVEEWLPHLGFRAAPHSVSLRGATDLERLVFGVMVLPPEDWPLAPGEGAPTFGEWWRRAQDAVLSRSNEEAEQGAASSAQSGDSEHPDHLFAGCLSSNVLTRRLQDQANACPAGSMYCWMQCQQIPEDLECDESLAMCISEGTGEICDESDQHTHDAQCKPTCPRQATGELLEVIGAGECPVGGDLVCNGVYKAIDHSGGKAVYKLASSSTSDVLARIAWDEHYRRWELYAPGYKNGSVLYLNEADSSLPPEAGWESFSGHIPAPFVRYAGISAEDAGVGSGSSSGEEITFCNGVLTDMHMLGFTWADEEEPCLIFLFPGWELTDSAKFYVAMVGTICAGVFAEFLVAARRIEARSSPRCLRKLGPRWRKAYSSTAKLFLYASTRTVGYLVMLISMMYSGEMFLALIFGLTLGHGIFNLREKPTDDTTACCGAGSTDESAMKGARVERSCCTCDDKMSGRGSSGVVETIFGAGIGVVPDAEGRLRLHVSGMTCSTCEGAVSKAARAVAGVLGVAECSASTGSLVVLLAPAPGGGAGGAGGLDRRAAISEEVQRAVGDIGFKCAPWPVE